MRQDIKSALLELQISGGETRKKKTRNISISIILTGLFLWAIPYYYPQLSQLTVLGVIFVIITVFYAFFDAIPRLYQPLSPEFYAFKKIVNAIQTLEESSKPIAYKEAYRCLKNANEILKKMESIEPGWYSEVDGTLEHFYENLELRVLPATSNSRIKVSDLEEVALALYSTNTSKIKTINKTLESKYDKSEPTPTKAEKLLKKFRQHTNKITVHGLVIVAFIILCIAFYILVVNNSWASKDYAFGGSIALFIGLLTIYFTKKPK